MILEYYIEHDLARLNDELLTIPGLQPSDGNPSFHLEGKDSYVKLTVYVTVTPSLRDSIDAIMADHEP
jgi:hypothetical protein